LINDLTGNTLACASSLGMEKLPKLEQAKKVGALVAEKAKAAGVVSIVFDRNGYLYHGRVRHLLTQLVRVALNFNRLWQ
jgi:large subunit ribosomal protein L18